MNHVFTLRRSPNKVTVIYNGVVVGYVVMEKTDPYARAAAVPMLASQEWWPKLKTNIGQFLVGVAALSELPGTVVIES